MTMKYLLKICFYFGLASTFVLGSTDMASNKLNQSLVEVKTELFASADDDSKKNGKKSPTFVGFFVCGMMGRFGYV